jgi:Bacterial Ig-like domain (group 3)/Lamin Tail Domain/MBG domain
VYGGGGNSGATYTNDFIELYNSGSTPVSLDGWSVQATSATATSWTANGAITLLSGTIQPGHYYLVQESQGNGGTTPLPTPDATGVITMSGTQAKVALVAGTVALSGACPSGIVDLVGYGGSNCFEAQATPGLSNTTAAIRRGNGCVDTDNNLNDFLIAGPIPRNSASPVNACGGDPSQPSGSGLASPDALEPAGNTLLTVQVAPATLPPSTNVSVAANLTSIGGSATQQLFDDGTNGDQSAGDNVFSFLANVDRLATTGPKSMVATIADGQGRTATAPITLTVVSPTCGVERWTVKVGVDPDAANVDVNNPMPTTIVNLRSFPAPADPPGPPDNARVFPWEGTVYTIDGTLTLYKKENDVDYHIVIQDAQGNTIVTEIPSPACIVTSGAPRVPAPSPFTAGISIARGKFDGRFTPTTFFQTANVPVRVTGVGFFDFIHGQTGVAPNGFELHPILDITFTAPTTTSLASTPNPSAFGAQVTLTAAVSNNGAAATPAGNVTFFDGGTALASRALDNSGVATFVTTHLGVGSHSITATYDGDGTSAPSSTAAALVQVVSKADQTIAFAPLPSKTYGDVPFTVSAAGGGSTSPVTFAASGNCTSSGTNGSTITIAAAGTCTVTASQLGDANFNAAADVSQTFAISQAAANVAVTGYSGVYDGHAHGATGSAHGVSGEDLTSLLNLGATFTDVPGGTAHWSFAGNTNYASAAGDAAIVISQAAATIHVNGFNGVYDGNAHGATGSATGVSGENLTSLLNLGASFTNVPGGTAHWTFAGNTDYAPAAGDATIAIAQAAAHITVNGYSGVYDGNAHGATGSATGVNGENLTSLLSLGASFTNVPGGNANWTFAGNQNYAPASGTAHIIINPALPVVTVSAGVQLYDGTPKTATATATGIGGVTVAGSFTFTYNGSPTAPTLPGTYAVVASFISANVNYANTTGTGTLTIGGLRDDLQSQLNAIVALRDATTNKQDLDRLNDAIKHLGEALEPDQWADSIHGTSEGDGIFTEGKNALIPLPAIVKDAKSSIAPATLQPIINRIVADLRQLALTAINDATARGANTDKPRAELAKGDADVHDGQYESGIEHYRAAWNAAVKL